MNENNKTYSQITNVINNIITVLLIIADILISIVYLIFSIASTFDLYSFIKPFIYISFILSLIILLISSINKLKQKAQENKIFVIALSIFVAFLYTSLRINILSEIIQFEDAGTAMIIVLNYLFVLFDTKKNHSIKEVNMKIESISRDKYGNEEFDSAVLEQWKTCVEMANSNTEKRTNSNNIFITINSALLAVISFSLNYKSIVLSVIGIAVCIIWLSSIESYRKLSSVKYHIVNEIELKLPLKPFTYEWEILRNETKYLGLTKIEKVLPWLFIVLYTISISLPAFKWIASIICTCNGG